ncbi:hypothetical protein HU72_16765 [Salmonella enterica subsp. enterica serovar Bere]|nr:hypothetical protein [Salmonella enterica subsp. enterica serovar Enteritidis]EBV5862723.1 hypothetical protein [Salmonella enterica subsp. enterica serovar Bere]ECC3883668.1 hypothetical protein [Salmonella enterica subsp. diarizonae]EIN1489781.1 hypothetical protein [Salmonella enterica]ECJ4780795.1 hypothetical protein [Salmonella enterica subsp. diarizonae]
MINPDKSLAQKALAGAQFLRMHSEGMAGDDDFFIALMSEHHAVADDAIEQIVEENEKLRAQLVAFQKAANPVFAVDPAKNDSEHTCYTPFVKGARVCLKVHPYQRGTIVNTRFDDRRDYLISVRFESEFEIDRWVKAKNLELIPDE